MHKRDIARWSAVGLSGLTAFLYLLIGLNVVSIGEMTSQEQTAFGLPAAVVFVAGSVVATFWDKRWLWTLGAAGLALIVFMYFNLASQREPAFELWGILIRVVQVPLLISLIYLAFTSPTPRTPEDAASREQDQAELTSTTFRDLS